MPPRYERLYSGASKTPVLEDAANGDYTLYPNNIYQASTVIYLPRTQASNVWSPVGHGQNTPGKNIPGELVGPTSAVLPPRPSHFQPATIIPAPRGPHPGLSYVTAPARPFPMNMAPERFYRDPKVRAMIDGVV